MLCFDLKKPSYVPIDHIVRMGTTTNRYGPIPLTLHKFFCYYLKSQRHPSLKALSKMEANIQNLPWSVIKSGDNYGLYLMRHMECYMGEREGMWETGLTGKGMIDSAAFLGLLYKYMAEIFTSVINKFKEMIDKELTEFKKLDENGRAKLLAEAETRNLKNKRKRGGRIVHILSSSDWNMHYPLNSYQNLQNTHCLHRSYFDPSINHTTHIYYEPNIKAQIT
ncbi:hypothetical protein LXL04_016175 [Taraxacum kok-saghyz]